MNPSPEDDELRERAARMDDEAREIIARQNRKIEAFERLARRLTVIVLVLLLLALAQGAVAIVGANISARNNRVLHESEYAFCAAGLPPPSIANTPGCLKAARRTAVKNAGQVDVFAERVCQKVAHALGGLPSRCAPKPTPRKT